MTSTLPQLRGLPKIELHRHLDCALRWSTVTEIAQNLGLEISPRPALSRDKFLITQQMKDLESVLKKFLNTQKVLASEEILTRLAYEACEDAYNENTCLVEFRFAPTFINEGHSQLSFDKVHRALVKGLEMAEKKFGMTAGLIGIIQRVKPIQEAEKVIDFIIDHKDDYIGIDLADNEEGFDPKPFAPLFTKAKKAGLHITVHAGEAPSPKAGQRILDSIEYLGAERIGHGVQCIYHPEVMEVLRNRNIPLEVCLLSNWLTQAFPNFQDHPLKSLYQADVPLTLNTDDPGIFASTLTDEYDLAIKHHGLGLADFKKLNRIAFEKSFLPESKKNKWKDTFQ